MESIYQSLPLEIPVLNQYEYQFKILAYDTVGNKEDIAFTLMIEISQQK